MRKNIVRIELVSGTYDKTTLVSGMERAPLGLALPAAEDRLLIASNAGYIVTLAPLPPVVYDLVSGVVNAQDVSLAQGDQMAYVASWPRKRSTWWTSSPRP